MIASGALTVFVLGLRHGADPDHLAAIDAVTRSSYVKAPKASRWVGTLFAVGHAVMVLAISALVGLLGQRFITNGALIERIGGWISVALLVTIAVANLRALREGGALQLRGAKTRLLPRALREAGNAFVAVPIGLLFGFGFETSSQIATYTLAFAADAGMLTAVILGTVFCAGMVCTDTLDCAFVHRLIAYRGTALPHVMRVWIWSVSLLSIAVAVVGAANLLGFPVPVPDLVLSAALVAVLAIVFAYVFIATRRSLMPLPPVSQGELS